MIRNGGCNTISVAKKQELSSQKHLMPSLKFKNVSKAHITRAQLVMKDKLEYLNVTDNGIEVQLQDLSVVPNNIGSNINQCTLPDGSKLKILTGGPLTGPIFMPVDKTFETTW